MKQHFHKAKQFIKNNSETVVGTGVVAALVAIVGIVALVNHLSGPVIVYQPSKACDLFTVTEARSLLGEDVLNTESNTPIISGDTAVSKCSYTDTNPNANAMKVAAVAIRSGINDAGQAKNVADFAAAKSSNTVEAVKDLGDDAYFNRTSGQINVLDNKRWLIMSYGLGSSPEANTLDDAVSLAHKVL